MCWGSTVSGVQSYFFHWKNPENTHFPSEINYSSYWAPNTCLEAAPYLELIGHTESKSSEFCCRYHFAVTASGYRRKIKEPSALTTHSHSCLLLSQRQSLHCEIHSCKNHLQYKRHTNSKIQRPDIYRDVGPNSMCKPSLCAQSSLSAVPTMLEGSYKVLDGGMTPANCSQWHCSWHAPALVFMLIHCPSLFHSSLSGWITTFQEAGRSRA